MVETSEQARFLKQRSCPYMQGYLFSRPLPAEAFTRLLSRAPRDRFEPLRDVLPRAG